MPTAELLNITTTDSLENPRAVLTYKVFGLAAGDHNDEAVRAALPFQTGSPYPLSPLACICRDIVVVEWWDPTTALVQAVFGTTRFSLPTRVIAQVDIQLGNTKGPLWVHIASTPDGKKVYQKRDDGFPRKRPQITKNDFRQFGGQLSPANEQFIASQLGKRYTFGGSAIPYLLKGASATSASNGLTNVRYLFVTTGSLPALTPAQMGAQPNDLQPLALPALGPLDEYIDPIRNTNPIIGVLKAEDGYVQGEPLP